MGERRRRNGSARRFSPSTVARKATSPPMADTRQVVQQPGPEAAVLPLVVNDYSDFGVILARPAVVASHGDDLLAHLRDQRLVELVVEPGQVQDGAAWARHR